MEQNTKENGEIIRLMEKASSGMLMGMSMKETGKMTRLTVMVFTHM